jgi:hypothetical protein
MASSTGRRSGWMRISARGLSRVPPRIAGVPRRFSSPGRGRGGGATTAIVCRPSASGHETLAWSRLAVVSRCAASLSRHCLQRYGFGGSGTYDQSRSATGSSRGSNGWSYTIDGVSMMVTAPPRQKRLWRPTCRYGKSHRLRRPSPCRSEAVDATCRPYAHSSNKRAPGRESLPSQTRFDPEGSPVRTRVIRATAAYHAVLYHPALLSKRV